MIRMFAARPAGVIATLTGGALLDWLVDGAARVDNPLLPSGTP